MILGAIALTIIKAMRASVLRGKLYIYNNRPHIYY